MTTSRNTRTRLRATGVAVAALAIGLLAAQAFGSFGTARNFSAGQAPRAVVIGQFNADTKRDLVVANATGVAILAGIGGGNFGKPRTFPVASGPRDLAAGRFNADNNLDLVVTGPSTNVSILLGNGKGAFGSPTEFSNGPAPRWSPRSVAVADMNGDGIPDVVTASTEGISVLTGNGDGTFAAPLLRDIGGTAPTDLALGDFNGDRNTDVVFGTGPAMNFVGVLLGTGDGGFSSYTQFHAGHKPQNVAVGQLNGDRNLDIVAANSGSNTLSVLAGRGDGTFGPFRTFRAANAPASGPGTVVVRDLNSDGRSDLAVVNGGPSSVGVLIGNGRGSFAAPAIYRTGKTPLGLASGNLNAGSNPDLVTANSGSNNVSVLLNAGPSARSITLGYKNAQRRFVGTIRSSDSTCVSRQRVRILKRRTGPDRQVGSAVTGEAGNFRLGYGRKPGNYYARARAWSACRAENSNVIRIRR